MSIIAMLAEGARSAVARFAGIVGLGINKSLDARLKVPWGIQRSK
jgi:hypothetical protein